MTEEQLATFRRLCRGVLKLKGGGYYLPYAQTYARAGLDLTDQEMVRAQTLYILSNLSSVRAKGAKEIREGFKKLSKELK